MVEQDNCIGLYIHIPFCKSKCFYCDFNSYAQQEDLIPDYFEALKREIMLYAEKLKNYSIKTVFIGGGTPSLVEPSFIHQICTLLTHHFTLQEGCEISIETNPGTLSLEKLTVYKESGINRISMGMQASQNHLLKSLGRIHTMEEIIESVSLAKKVGFENINLDMIFGIPGQEIRDWEETIESGIALGVTHLSCYSLKIEEQTVFGKQLENKTIFPCEDELDRKMYTHAIDQLQKSGFCHYEISNFAKPGYESKHNLIYWKAEPYIGLGAGAHSYFDAERFNNKYNITEYIKCLSKNEIPTQNSVTITREDEISEYMILGLRLVKGINIPAFQKRFGISPINLFGEKIEKLIQKDWLKMNGDDLMLTPLGLDLANQVFVEFI